MLMLRCISISAAISLLVMGCALTPEQQQAVSNSLAAATRGEQAGRATATGSNLYAFDSISVPTVAFDTEASFSIVGTGCIQVKHP